LHLLSICSCIFVLCTVPALDGATQQLMDENNRILHQISTNLATYQVCRWCYSEIREAFEGGYLLIVVDCLWNDFDSGVMLLWFCSLNLKWQTKR